MGSLIEAFKNGRSPRYKDELERRRRRCEQARSDAERFYAASLASGKQRKYELEQELKRAMEANVILRQAHIEEQQQEDEIRMQLDRLKLVYTSTGIDTTADDFRDNLAGIGDVSGRLVRVKEEVERAEGLKSSLENARVLTLLQELRELATPAGKNVVSFEKDFARRYPELHDTLIEAIRTWEEEEGTEFLWNGTQVREQLLAIRHAQDEGTVKMGDVAMIGWIAWLLSERDSKVGPLNIGPPTARKATKKLKKKKTTSAKQKQVTSALRLSVIAPHNVTTTTSITRRLVAPSR